MHVIANDDFAHAEAVEDAAIEFGTGIAVQHTVTVESLYLIGGVPEREWWDESPEQWKTATHLTTNPKTENGQPLHG